MKLSPPDRSAALTIIGVVLLFAISIGVTLLAPRYVDKSWTTPASHYQTQMYTVADPNIYISSTGGTHQRVQYVYHLQNQFTLLAFQESATLRLIAPPELERYITRHGDTKLNLTSRLLLLRPAMGEGAEAHRHSLQQVWEEEHPNWEAAGLTRPHFQLFELYEPETSEAFALAETDGITENWIDTNYNLIDPTPTVAYHTNPGVLYVTNPTLYRVSPFYLGEEKQWHYDPHGEPVATLAHLTGPNLGFLSRQQLIQMGERLYAQEGCFNCHTDQCRTLVQDSVLNGSGRFPAPPSAANEYVYQEITFTGTRRIGPDLARVGIKRPGRDWHLSHFWAPKTESPGSIMPAFRHFFDADPMGSPKNPHGVPNWRFEALYQYLMTKGTRLTAPTEAWWEGRDAVNTLAIIEGEHGR
jgi:cytochrome c oxidase cbb3-type subunit 2